MRGWQKLIRRGLIAGLLGTSVWVAAPTHGEAQSCATQNGIYACTIGSETYSSGINIAAPGEVVYQGKFPVFTNALPTTVTSEATMNIAVSSSQTTALSVFAGAGGDQAPGGFTQGMVITNTGSLTLNQSQPSVIDNYLSACGHRRPPLPAALSISDSLCRSS